MKILDAYRFEVEARNVNDRAQNDHIEYVMTLVVGHKNLGPLTKETTIYIPYELWVTHGGNPAIVPYCVQLVHGLDEVTTSLEGKVIPRRNFLVPDQASENDFVVRTHLTAYAINTSGEMVKSPGKVYCGQRSKGEGVTHTLDDVTCPECLMELKRINQSH